MNIRDPLRRPGGPWNHEPEDPKRFNRRFLIILALIAGIILGVTAIAPPLRLDARGWGYLAQAVLVLFIVSSGIAASRRRLSAAARDAALWGGIFLVLFTGYAYRSELGAVRDRLMAEFQPSEGHDLAPGVIAFRRGTDGQFRINAVVNGQKLRFLLDTGASEVVLTTADAARLGFDPAGLDYSQTFQTANGLTRGAPVELGTLQIGSIRFDHLPASVNEGDLGESLLGMRLLERLSRIEIGNDTLTIRE